ncbi:hypothetical protein Mpt1_c03280 [Candidatus Methanoplasma termitum]|uniref:Uncharacterized protein n=1 Tax=Candidatus Methanoplasma termitum TaxID=1577791 RepID=A0A0A7LAN9_9ARCH|nr:hypothetical protein [Candidatus Methanoplasma termitum]AIZ56225.1 hypothetical protein Mpt1_c03280 [Candidatus Methanoplasma termitum]MCL2334387.1 hypothetical protein [Candidatus Methanoplasma sp.]
MKTNKKLISAFAVIGALVMLSVIFVAVQSADSNAEGAIVPVDEVVKYDVTFELSAGITWKMGNVTIDNTNNPMNVDSGTKITVTVTLNQGYVGTPAITAGGSPYTAGTEYTVTSAVTFKVASGVEQGRVITFITDPGITWKYNGSPFTNSNITVETGKKITVDATVNDGYEGILAIMANGIPYSMGAEFPVNADITFMASGIHPKTFAVTFEANPGIVWKYNGNPVTTSTVTVTYGTPPIKVTTGLKPGYEGTPIIKAGTATYTAGDDFTVASDVTFTASGVQLMVLTVTFKDTPGVTWVLDGENLVGSTTQITYGDKIKVNVTIDHDFEGTPVIKAGTATYTAGDDFEVTSNVEFTVAGVSHIDNNSGGNSTLMYVAIAVAVILIICLVLWYFLFRKP